MFLNQVMKHNRALVDTAVALHASGAIQPDTYVIDFDQTLRNAKMILDAAKTQNIELYFMLKQLGRNPLLAKALLELGYKGAVVVDFREALVMMEHNIPLGNVGHLVQTPKALLEKIIRYGTEVMTVFSIEKLREINEVSAKIGCIQSVILKVYSEGDLHYSGQEGGISLEELPQFIEDAKQLSSIEIVGATAFPAFLYNAQAKSIAATHNFVSIMKAITIMEAQGCKITHINAPSTTSVRTISLMAGTPVTHGEPGHSLTGTTPAHACEDMDEKPTVVYVSEISHNFQDKSYCYGGGHYRRSHVSQALNVTQATRHVVDVIPIEPDNIDYYFQLAQALPVSSTVIMAFRFQIFVTRSQVAIVKGIGTDSVEIMGIYDSLGKKAKA